MVRRLADCVVWWSKTLPRKPPLATGVTADVAPEAPRVAPIFRYVGAEGATHELQEMEGNGRKAQEIEGKLRKWKEIAQETSFLRSATPAPEQNLPPGSKSPRRAVTLRRRINPLVRSTSPSSRCWRTRCWTSPPFLRLRPGSRTRLGGASSYSWCVPHMEKTVVAGCPSYEHV